MNVGMNWKKKTQDNKSGKFIELLVASPSKEGEATCILNIKGVANQQIKPPQSPFEKGGSKKTAIYGWALINISGF